MIQIETIVVRRPYLSVLPHAGASRERELDELRNLPIQSRSKQLVERIIDATARILADGKHTSLTTNAAAEEAGISVGSLYRYFPNKEALIVAVIEREGRRFHEQVRGFAGYQSSGDLAEHVGQVVKAIVRAYRSIAADDALSAVELRRAGIFDRRTAALSAITDSLRSAGAAHRGTNMAICDSTIAITAEIIVSLIDAAMIRPSSALSARTVEAAATEAALAYLAARQNASKCTDS